MLSYLLFSITLVYLVIASISDIKTREVPDWLNFSLIIVAIAARLIYSLLLNNFSQFFYGLFGFGIFFLFACLLFYTGNWGGGDSKLLMGMRAVIGFQYGEFPVLALFIINLLLVGAIYALVWSLSLAIIKRDQFIHEFRKLNKDKKIFRIKVVFWSISIAFLGLALLYKEFIILFVSLAIIFYITVMLFITVKAVEQGLMIKQIDVNKLTEGDWLAHDVILNNKLLLKKTKIGLEKKDIEKLLKSRLKKIDIREGIPFIPSFLLAYLVTYFFGNWLLYLL